MIKYVHSLSVFVCCIFSMLYFSSCKNNKIIHVPINSEFVYVDHNAFKINRDTFFPMMLNYVVDFREINHQLFLSPCKAYENINYYEHPTKEATLRQLDAHFQLIKKIGFNSLRICLDRISCDKNGKFYYVADNQAYYIEKDSKKIISALDECIQIAAKNNLRVLLLIKPPIKNNELKKFTINILSHFKNNPYLFAYDFMNEPLYFDDCPKRKKNEAYKIVCEWKQLMNEYAPNQLFTIGFSEPIEVFEWDPSILPVDFVEIHTYHPLRVPNEIYWYSKYIHKPWMIGETALPADNDSISYEMQRQFLVDVYHYTVDCGGCGFGWWEFQEVANTHFEAQYTGLLNHDSSTLINDYKIIGTLKPAAYEIQSLKNYKRNKPQQAVNYYNMMGYSNICISGKIINKNNNHPVEGAVIRAWNDDWSVGLNTFTDKNGVFYLYSNDECTHFEISAPGMTKIKFNKKITYSSDIEYSHLPQRKLEYHKISFIPFLTDTTLKNKDIQYPIFNFKVEMFNRAAIKGNIGTLYLKDL